MGGKLTDRALPAFEPVPVYEVVIDGDDVLIDTSVTKATA